MFAQPLSLYPVADLIVVLGKHYQFAWWKGRRRVAMTSFSEAGIATGKNEPLPEAFNQILESAEVLVVAGFIISKEGSQGVVKIITPLGIEAKTPKAAVIYQA